jgi:hypothetical protein
MGFENLNQFTHTITDGVVPNGFLVEELGNSLASKVVDEISTRGITEGLCPKYAAAGI